MRLLIHVLGTELLDIKINESSAPVVSESHHNHNGSFEIGFVATPTTQPLPSDVEARGH